MVSTPLGGARHKYDVWDSRMPPEFYGRSRDDVNLLAVDRSAGVYSSTPFRELTCFIRRGDLLVFNNSAIVPSSLPVYDAASGLSGWLNVGTSRENGMIIVEARPKRFNATLQNSGGGLTVLGDGSRIRLVRRNEQFNRFFWATAGGEDKLRSLLDRFGAPVSYDHIPFKLPMSYYTTFCSAVPGSAEFPSASRPFSPALLRALEAKGASMAYLTLHCNLSPLEPHEFSSSPSLLEEWYNMPEETAAAVEGTREKGGRVIAVGTSVVRALESSYRGKVVRGASRTDLFIRPGHTFETVDGIITGLHDPDSSHVEMISAFMDDSLLRSAYATASALGYQWHEFGDLSIIV